MLPDIPCLPTVVCNFVSASSLEEASWFPGSETQAQRQAQALLSQSIQLHQAQGIWLWRLSSEVAQPVQGYLHGLYQATSTNPPCSAFLLMGCFWDYLNISCWCFFQFFDIQNEKYYFLLETVKAEKLSPQTIPVACNVLFLRQEVLLQTGINVSHVLSSWEPADLSLDIVHLSEPVQLFQAFHLTRKQLKF